MVRSTLRNSPTRSITTTTCKDANCTLLTLGRRLDDDSDVTAEMWTTLATPGGVLLLSIIAFGRGWVIPRWTLTLIQEVWRAQLAQQEDLTKDWRSTAETREAINVELSAAVREMHTAMAQVGREVNQILTAVAAPTNGG